MVFPLTDPPNQTPISDVKSASLTPVWATWFQTIKDAVANFSGIVSVSGTAGQIDVTAGPNPVISLDPALVLPAANIDPNVTIRAFGCSKGDGTTVPLTGFSGVITIPYTGTITKWYMAADQAGSAVFDVKRSGASIVGGGGNKPTLTAQQFANAVPAGWSSVAVTVGDEITFNLDSVATCQFIDLVLTVNPS